MLFEIGGQACGNDIIHNALDFQISKLRLGLPFELGIGHLHGNNAGKPFADVVAGKIVLVIFQNIILAGVVIEHAGQRRAETGEVHAAFDGIDVIDEGVHVFAVALLVLHGDVYDDLVLLAFKRDDGGIHQVFAFVQELHEFGDAAGVVEFFLMGGAVAQVRQGDGEAFIQESQLAHADLQGIEIEIHAFFENFNIRLEGDRGTGLLGFAVGLHVLGHFAAGESHFMEMPFSANNHLRPFGEGIHHRNTYAVEAAGNGIAITAEFTAGVKHGQYDFHGGLSGLVHTRRDAAAIIDDSTAAIVIQGHFDVGAVAGQRFIDTVVHHFVDQVMQPAGRCGTDVHARTQTHGFEAFEDAYVLGAVIAFPIFLCVVSLDFMNIFRHIFLLHIKNQRPKRTKPLFYYIYI